MYKEKDTPGNVSVEWCATHFITGDTCLNRKVITANVSFEWCATHFITDNTHILCMLY